jgi:hypothetical protein
MTGRREADDLPDIRSGDAPSALEGRDDRAIGIEPDHRRLDAGALAVTRWSVLMPMGVAPSWMQAAIARLESAFPAFSFAVGRGWRGPRFEAWRDPGAGGLYAVITDDPRELWRELEMAQQ